MSPPLPSSTPNVAVNAMLAELLVGARTAIGPRFVGMYLLGSLALGDFNPESSDIDVVIVSDSELSAENVEALRAMHARLAAGAPPWATELECYYIPEAALRRYDPAEAWLPRVERGSGDLCIAYHASDWVVQRHILRVHGVALAGPDPRTLIDPVAPDELRRAVAAVVAEWWAPKGHDPARLRHRGYHAFAVLTMCRVLHTLDTGAVASKPVAARYTAQARGGRWAALIEQALAWRRDQQGDVPPEEVQAARELILYAAERCCESEHATGR